jgi:hypothetical protein
MHQPPLLSPLVQIHEASLMKTLPRVINQEIERSTERPVDHKPAGTNNWGLQAWMNGQLYRSRKRET